jgi:hypothetical protein
LPDWALCNHLDDARMCADLVAFTHAVHKKRHTAFSHMCGFFDEFLQAAAVQALEEQVSSTRRRAGHQGATPFTFIHLTWGCARGVAISFTHRISAKFVQDCERELTRHYFI